MADNINPNDDGISNFLPRFYRSDANKKFLQATIEQLVKPGTVKKINGYIGKKNAKATTGNDIFVSAPTASRANYQLEPSISIEDTLGNTEFFKDYQDYINQLEVFGANVKNHSRLNKQEFYSWDPHIEWDKFVNFQQYYWLPYGPDVITIYGQQRAISSTYSITIETQLDDKQYLFTPNGLTRNPTLKLYRGQTYHFDIDAPGEPFSIKTIRSTGTDNRYSPGLAVDNHGVEKGSVTFTVPDNCPDVLFYVSENNIDLGGVFQVLDIKENTEINVDLEIVGKKTYTLPGGVSLSNGMKITFGGNVLPAEYATGQFYVEGVGTAITLIPEASLELVTSYSEEISILFDDTKFDEFPFSNATAYSGQVDYIVINRASRDRNPWSRYNKWFHKDVIEASAAYNGNIPSLDQNTRAVRPIIEFDANLKLFNFGLEAGVDVDLIDTFTTDVFSTIEGTIGYNVDGIPLVNGHKILFTADNDILVKNKIYRVQFIEVQDSVKQTRSRQIHLVLDSEPVLNQVVVVRQGNTAQGTMRWYDGTTWNVAQNKTSLNQSPLFDVVDSNGNSFSDRTVYDGSTFSGTTIFEYKKGAGTADTYLKFPLSYRNINNVGDIVFNFTAMTDSFQYKEVEKILQLKVSTGYFVKSEGNNAVTYENGWQTSLVDSKYQPALRIYKNSGLVNNFDIDIFNNKTELTDLEVRIYVNGIRLDNSLWSVVDGAVYKKVILATDITESDVLTIKAFAKQAINSNGYYEVPVNLQNNPLNGEMGDFTLGEVIDHVNSIVDNSLTRFSGQFPGNNNLRDLGNITPYGTKFVQHSGPMSVALYHVASPSNNIIRAIEKAREEYGQFKRNFMSVALTLGVETTTKEHVDLILQSLNKDKPKKSPYYFSDMVPYGSAIKNDYPVIDYRIKTYPLSAVFDVTYLSNKAVCVYLTRNEVVTQLLYGIDYTFSDQGFVSISKELVNDDTVTIYEYDNTDGCFVPQTPTKLGIWPKYEPKIYTDTSLITPRLMIQGHDGSQILAYNDYRDELILELEKRIFNNIKVAYDASIFDIHDVIPSYVRENDYSLSEFNEILAPSFYKWTSLIDRDFSKPLSFDRSNSLTFNYRGQQAPDGRETPGYWRGIYRWMLDTDRPNICPWEMLGFSIEPTWWSTVYGVAPYTKDNLVMWQDLSDGVIREPGKPLTRNAKFARPFLINCIPVDSDGNLVSPITSSMASGVITTSTEGDFVFGDVSPVEAAWRRSSYYAFSVLIAALLLKPANVLGRVLDRSRIIKNLTGQLIYKDTGLRVTAADIVLPNIYSSTTRVQTAGLINYIVDYILSDNLKSYDQYVYDLNNINFKLSYRIGGFTSKEKFNLLLDSKNPTAVGGVFVPQENYKIVLNSSSPIKKLTYSGVIITKLQDGYEVKGYSKSKPFFEYYPWIQSGFTINVGGISESFSIWASGERYVPGSVVSYSNSFYRVTVSHVSTAVFETANFQRLAKLPIVGGRDAIMRKLWDRTSPIVVPYGTKFRTIQEVVDFLVGYGEVLKDQGFVFDDFNATLSQITNWETSAKEFLFWTTQNWSTGQDKWDDWLPETPVAYGSIVRYNGDYYKAARNVAAAEVFEEINSVTHFRNYTKLDGLSTVGSSVISLSPAANKIVIRTEYSVVDDILNQFNGYEIFKVDGSKLEPNFLNSYRSGNLVSYSPADGSGIFGASFFLVQKEQVLLLDNTTLFNDVIYNPESGYRQERIKTSSYVSTLWDGSFDVAGFIFDQAKITDWTTWTDYALGDIVKYKEFYYSATAPVVGADTFVSSEWTKLTEKPQPALLPNWSYKAAQFEDFYSLDSGNFDVGQQTMAQHLTGYQPRQYLSNIIKDDVSEFKFYQGMIIEKGTQNSLNKLFDVLSAEGQESLKFFEEWAVRVGQYGASAAFEDIEFVLDQALFKNNPQGFELTQLPEDKYDFIIRQTPNDLYLKPLGYKSTPWKLTNNFIPFLRTPGYVREEEVSLVLDNIADVLAQDPAPLDDGNYIWCAFEGREWNVYRYTATTFKVLDATYSSNTLVITTDQQVELTAGTYVSIVQVDKIAGFYKIDSVSLNTFTIKTTLKTPPASPFASQETAQVFFLTPQRAASIDVANTILPARVSAGEKMWTDNIGDGRWGMWQYNPVYTKRQLVNSTPKSNLEYGRQLALSSNGSYAVVSTADALVIAYDKVPGSTKWLQRQTISIPFICQPANTGDQVPGYFAETVAVSADGEWVAIGSPQTSNASTKWKGTYSDTYAYSAGDIVKVGPLHYVALLASILIPVSNTTYWKRIKYIETTIDGVSTGVSKHGVVSLYKKDASANVNLVATIASPNIVNDELFGSHLVFGNNKLFVSAAGYDSGKGRVYQLDYNTISTTSTYQPVGSSGTTLRVASTANIEVGMAITGIGFTSLHTVTQIVNGSTIRMSEAPNSTPFGILTFTISRWEYSYDTNINSVTLPAGALYGDSVAVNNDGTTLAISAPAANKVFVFGLESDTYVLSQTITSTLASQQFGESVALSATSNYLAVGATLYDGDSLDQGRVLVYELNNGTYSLYQTLESHKPETAEFFGSKVAFMNDYETLVVYSANGDSYKLAKFDGGETIFDNGTLALTEYSVDSGRVDIFDRYASKWVYSETLEVNESPRMGDGYGQGFAVGRNSIVVSAPYASDLTLRSGTVYTYDKPRGLLSWTTKYTETAKPDISKIKKAFLYNKSTNELIKYIDIIDPIQGKIPGIAEQEIKFKTFYDPATYSVGTGDEVNVDDGMAWTSEKVGMLWWDLRRAKFIDSYGGDVVYKNTTWNTLFKTASIDVYEWVETNLLPSAWDKQADTDAGLTLGISGTSLYGDAVYSVKKRYDTVSRSFKNTYYYWVKNKKTIPNAQGRNMSANNVANLIANPKGEGYAYLALTSANSFSLVNVKPLLQDTDVVLAVQYWTIDQSDQNVHSQWRLISEDVNSSIPASIEEKWFDSLCGKDQNNQVVPDLNLPPKLRYGAEFRPRQSMFVNRFEALKQFVERANIDLLANQIVESRDISDLNSFDPAPSLITALYDVAFDTDAELRFASVSAVKVPTIKPVVSSDGAITGIEIVEAGNGYLTAPYIKVKGNGRNAEIQTVINARGQITGANIINGGEGYDDTTTFEIRNYSALVRSDSLALNRWSIYSYDPYYKVWSRTQSQAYDTRRYWTYVDWYAEGVNQFTLADFSVDTISDLSGIAVKIGQYVKIRTSGAGGWELLQKYADSTSIDWTQSYKVVGTENGTIQLSSELYRFTNTTLGYDGALFDGDAFDNTAVIELRVILNTLKNKVFVDTLKQTYLDLFFACLRYAFSEQTYLDWAFKTSFVRAQHNVGELKQKVTYNNDNLADFEAYIAEVKPYRTQIREYVSEYTKVDTSKSSVTDFDLLPVAHDGINSPLFVNNVDGDIQANDPAILTYPWKHWLDNVGFEITSLKLVDQGSGYVTEPVVRIIDQDTNNVSVIPATARAFITNGKVSRVVLLTPGSGYLTAPKIVIDGGIEEGGTPATAVAYIGNSVVRSNLIKMKFDRTSRTYFITELEETATFTGTGSKLQFILKWAPDLRIGKSSVTVDGVDIIRANYTLSINKSTVRGYTSYYGTLTFTTAPAKDSVISISYIKDWSLLNAADRIQYYYDPQTGQLGKDLAQLMTGVDYGGVIVTGLDFSVSSGWDSLPFFTDRWDEIDPTFDDYIIRAGLNSNEFDLPYIPEYGTVINIYHNGVRIDDPDFGTPQQTNVNATMQTFVGDGINSTVILPSIATTKASAALAASGSTQVEFASVEGIQVGSLVLSPNVIPVGTTVTAITGNTVPASIIGSIAGTTLTASGLTSNAIGMRVSGVGVAADTYITSVVASIPSVKEIQKILVSGVSMGPVTFLGQLIADTVAGQSAATVVIKIVAQRLDVIATWNTANPTAPIEELEIDLFEDGANTIKITYAPTAGNVAVIPQTSSSGINFAASVTTREGISGTTSTAQLTGGAQTVASIPMTITPIMEISNAILADIPTAVELVVGSGTNFTTGTQLKGTTKIALSNAFGISVGDSVSSYLPRITTTGIPTNTTVTAIDAVTNIVTLSNATTVAIPEDTDLTFGYNKLFFRKSTSDGSIKPQEVDYDTSLSGGNLAYSSATGLAADDILVDGDGFVTPTTGSDVEEVVPGQVVDAVAIKVFYRPGSGAANVRVDTHIANGTDDTFSMSQYINSAEAVLVKVDNTILTNVDDYVVNYKDKTVTLLSVPTSGQVVALFNFGFNGANVLDIDFFVGNGTTTEFITKSPWLATLSSLVYVDGNPEPYELFKTDNTYENTNSVGIRFGSAPADGQVINYVIVEGTDSNFSVINTERLHPTGTATELLVAAPIGNALPLTSNLIVRVDQSILRPANTSYYTINKNKLTYFVDQSKVKPYEPDMSDITVYADGNLLRVNVDYNIDPAGISVKITRGVYNTYKNKTLIICITTGQEYSIIPGSAAYSYVDPLNPANIISVPASPSRIVFATAPSALSTVEITSAYKHDVLDIQRTQLTIKSELVYTPDEFEYYNYIGLTGGNVALGRTVINDSSVWVSKNGTLLTPSVDYKLNEDRQSIKFEQPLLVDDKVDIITYSRNVSTETVSYMQFKDMLNRTHFKRLSQKKQAALVAALNYYDTEIHLDDATNFEEPNAANNYPGVVEIYGERIEYFAKNGNVLSRLRRATLGTGAAQVYPVGSHVQDIGPSETIPYRDTTQIEQITTTGESNIEIPFVPTSVDEIEVFVGGYDTALTWATGVLYSVGTIVQVGSYTYRCVTEHTSGTVFSADSTNWHFFVGNLRLKKHAFQVHNVSIHPESPEGDVSFAADFTVDGTTNAVQLTNALDAGVRVTVVKKTGRLWSGITYFPTELVVDATATDFDTGTTTFDLRDQRLLAASNDNINAFLKAEAGIWYTPAKNS